MKRNLSRAEFVRALKADGTLPLYMVDSHNRRVLDRDGNDEVFANEADRHGYGERGWCLTYREGGK